MLHKHSRTFCGIQHCAHSPDIDFATHTWRDPHLLKLHTSPRTSPAFPHPLLACCAPYSAFLPCIYSPFLSTCSLSILCLLWTGTFYFWFFALCTATLCLFAFCLGISPTMNKKNRKHLPLWMWTFWSSSCLQVSFSGRQLRLRLELL